MPPLQEIVLLYDKHEYAKKGKKMQTSGCGGAGCGAWRVSCPRVRRFFSFFSRPFFSQFLHIKYPTSVHNQSRTSLYSPGRYSYINKYPPCSSSAPLPPSLPLTTPSAGGGQLLLTQNMCQKMFLRQALMTKCVKFVEICLILEFWLPIRFLS